MCAQVHMCVSCDYYSVLFCPLQTKRYMYLSWTTVLWQMCEDLCIKHDLVTVECAEALCCPTQLTPKAIHTHRVTTAVVVHHLLYSQYNLLRWVTMNDPL